MRLGIGIGLNRFRGGQAAGITGLLDQFTGAAAAFSLDTLIYGDHSVEDTAVGSETEVNSPNPGDNPAAPYTVRVRRSTTPSAVRSFTHTEVGDGTLVTWVGAGNDGFVEAWYNQGSSDDAVQTAAANQPKIVNAGVLVTRNGRAMLNFTADLQHLIGDDAGNLNTIRTQGFTYISAAKMNARSRWDCIFSPATSTDDGQGSLALQYQDTTTNLFGPHNTWVAGASFVNVTLDDQLRYSLYSLRRDGAGTGGGNNATVYIEVTDDTGSAVSKNGTQTFSSNNGTKFIIGRQGPLAASPVATFIGEIGIIFISRYQNNTDFSNIKSIINNEYSIY